jgi:hypothetical protein
MPPRNSAVVGVLENKVGKLRKIACPRDSRVQRMASVALMNDPLQARTTRWTPRSFF